MAEGFLGGYLDTLESLSKVQGADALTATRNFALGQAQDQSQREIAFRNNLAAATPDAMATGGTAPPPAGMAMGGEVPKASALAFKEYEQNQKYAQIAAQSKDPMRHEKYIKDAEAALQRATAAQKEERLEDKEKWETIQQWATAANDADGLNQTYDLAVKRYGKEAVDVFKNMGFERSPEDGKLIWNAANAKRVEVLKEASMKEVDRVKRDQRDAEEQRRIQTEKDREEGRKDAAQHRKALEVIAQEGLDIRRDQMKAQKEAQQERNTRLVTNSVQGSLDKDPIYRDWSKYEGAIDLGAQAARQLADKDGYKNFNASDARALASSYGNMVEGFRARQGGKYSIQDMKQFNGLYQKLQAWTDSLGRGTPTFGEQTAKDVANTITQLGDIANKNVVISSLEARDSAAARKGDPNQIKMKGNLQRLVNIGQAYKEEKGGKEYLVIGKGDTAKRFEITPNPEDE
jgi:hypothetical protein